MAQYCRYCSSCYQVDEDKIWCEKKSICMSEKQCKHTNNCKQFDLNPIDVLRMNEKGYCPTGLKPVELGGLGKQIRIEEILNEERHTKKDVPDRKKRRSVLGRNNPVLNSSSVE